MFYSSSLTDTEWEILEPLSWCAFPSAVRRRGVTPPLPEVLPQKKKTTPLSWSYRALIDGMLYRLKNGCNWEDLPKDLPSYSTVFLALQRMAQSRLNCEADDAVAWTGSRTDQKKLSGLPEGVTQRL